MDGVETVALSSLPPQSAKGASWLGFKPTQTNIA